LHLLYNNYKNKLFCFVYISEGAKMTLAQWKRFGFVNSKVPFSTLALHYSSSFLFLHELANLVSLSRHQN